MEGRRGSAGAGTRGGGRRLLPRDSRFDSTARVFVGTKVHSSGNLYAAATFGATRVKSYAALATSQPVTSSVIHRLRLKEKPADVAKQVSATAVQDTVLIEITATADSATSAQRLARAESEALAEPIFRARGEASVGDPSANRQPRTTSHAPTWPRPVLTFAVAIALGLLLGIAAAGHSPPARCRGRVRRSRS